MNDINKVFDIALQEAVEGVDCHDGGPFGAVIVDGSGNVISSGHNMVLASNDPTAHAEIVAIRKACEKLKSYDLSGCTFYSSCEPCPMCLSAIIWSNIKCVYFGATRKDAEYAGFRDSDIYDFIAGKNTMLDKKYIANDSCIDFLKKYEGEIY